MKLNTKKSVVLVVAIFLAAILLTPYSTVSVPEWKIQLVDMNDQILIGTSVTQEWSHFAVMATSSQTITSDQMGFVTFPERTFFCPLLLRSVFGLMDLFNFLVMPHGARMGVHARVYSPEGNYYWLEYNGKGEMQHMLKIRNLSG